MRSSREASATVRVRLDITGVVQGVGFRPAVARTAARHGVTGFVFNDSGSVHCELEGAAGSVDAAVEAIAQQAPPMARIDNLAVTTVAPRGATAFEIVDSRTGAGGRTLIPPDIAICADCLRELTRSGRPPIRASVHHVHQLRTALHRDHRPALRPAGHHDGRLSACATPAPPSTTIPPTGGSTPRPSPARTADRRCRGSGRATAPTRWPPRQRRSTPATSSRSRGSAATTWPAGPTTRRLWPSCDAERARPAKPFAVMVADLTAAARIAMVSATAASVLASPAAPIVLLPRRAGGADRRGVARAGRRRADAGVHAGTPPAVRSARPGAAGHDVGQSGWLADRVPRRRYRLARRPDRRCAHPRPPDPCRRARTRWWPWRQTARVCRCVARAGTRRCR